MPELEDSDLAKWRYDFHTQIKHRILAAYLRSWVTVLATRHTDLVYVDAFAGRGRYAGGEAGSPLLAIDAALDVMKRTRTPPQSFTCHFVEPDAANFTNLASELHSYEPANDPRITYHLHNQRFAVISPSILRQLGQSQLPTFFFVDPFGYEDPTMDLLGQIIRLPRVEVFVTFMYDFANRAMGWHGNAAIGSTLDDLFGSHDWRSIVRSNASDREDRLINLYRTHLKARGAAFAIPFRMSDDRRARTLYYLVHATKHYLGAKIMKESMVAFGTRGQLGYGGETGYHLEPLFRVDAENLRNVLLTNLAGQALPFDGVLAQTAELSGACRESDYRTCLKQMEHAGQISVRRVSSKTTRGLGGKDEITFHHPG